MSDIPEWTGTPAPTPGPTPTTGSDKPWVQSTLTNYSVATPTPSDSLVSSTNVNTVNFLVSKAVEALMPTPGQVFSFFASRFGEKAMSAKATDMPDRSTPPQGIQGTSFLAPKDAQHIPGTWVQSITGRPYTTSSKPHYNRLQDTDYPAGSLIKKAGLDFVQDSFGYTSPFTGNRYESGYGMVRETHDDTMVWKEGYGIIPLYAWGVESVTRAFAKADGSASSTEVFKRAKHMFFKEVYDDWMALHGFDRYDVDLDGPPGLGWPGVLSCGEPFAILPDTSPEKVQGMRCWCRNNPFIAHIEFKEQIGTREHKVRFPKYRVEGNKTLEIEYPSGARPTRDEFPYGQIAGDEDIPSALLGGRVLEVDQDDSKPPTQAEYDAMRAERDGTTIPILPSNPPDEDTEMTPPAEDDEHYQIVFRGIDMNVGDGEFVDANGRTGMDPGGKSAYSVDQAAELFEPYENMYGFVFGNGMAYVNNMKPSVMNWDKVYNYNDQYDYYSKMVEVSDTPTKRVGYIYSTWRASDDYPAHYRGRIVTSTDALELIDQPRLRSFDFGKAVTPYTRQEFVDFLTKETWNGKNNNDGYYCLAFEVDEADGQGYTNGFM
jgi:hypothetical protein